MTPDPGAFPPPIFNVINSLGEGVIGGQGGSPIYHSLYTISDFTLSIPLIPLSPIIYISLILLRIIETIGGHV